MQDVILMAGKRRPTTKKDALEILRNGLLLAGLYALGLVLIDGQVLTLDYVRTNLALFAALYVGAVMVMRAVRLEYEDSLSRGVIVVIAAKFVSALVPLNQTYTS